MDEAMIDPHLPKFFDMYWAIVDVAAKQSKATRAQVGALIVTPTGMLSIGYNGTPSGWHTNECEHWVFIGSNDGDMKTKPEVIHAERNAIDKMTRQGVPVEGSILLVSMAPCIECAKSIHGLGFKAVYYDNEYKNSDGLLFLSKLNIRLGRR